MDFLPLSKKQSFDSNNKCFFVGVSGASASGKTYLCEKLKNDIGLKECAIIPLDAFYKGVDKSKLADVKDYNFDHPNAIDFDLTYECVLKLVQGSSTEIPIYDFVSHSRLKQSIKIKPSRMILLEGILTFTDERIVNLMDLKIFIQTDSDICLARRLSRDTQERGRTVESVLYQYNRFVKPAYDEFIKPTMKFADLIVPGGANNKVAIDFIKTNLKIQLSNTSELKLLREIGQVRLDDIFGNSWLQILDQDNSLNKEETRNFINKHHVLPEKEYLSLLNMFNISFSVELFNLIIKRYFKAGMRMLAYEIYLKKIDTQDLVVMSLNSTEFPDIENQQYVLAYAIFSFQNSIKSIINKLKFIQRDEQIKKIYMITLFSEKESLFQLKQLQKVEVINVLCLNNPDELINNLKENCYTKNVNLFDESFLHSKILKLYNRYLIKKIVKYKGEAHSSDSE